MFLQRLRARLFSLSAAILVAGCDPGLTANVNTNDSVFDVLQGERPGDEASAGALIRARIRNESSLAADVNLRFVRGSRQVHSAFVRVLPGTITTVATPRLPESLELSGEDEMGAALTEEVFIFGRDFDEQRPAEYWIRDPNAEPPPDRPTPGTPTTRIVLLEPALDLQLVLGEALSVVWSDDSIDPGATIDFYLRPAGNTLAQPVPLRGGLPVAGDGLADQTDFVLHDLRPGAYELLARIQDGAAAPQWAIAPGLITLVRPISNVAPTLSILSPDRPVTLMSGDALDVRWTDRDPDDNAVLEFRLESVDRAAESFAITPLLSEDAESAGDSIRAHIDLLPGVYDLVGHITDGRLSSEVRLARWVIILPEPQNDPPQLVMHEPAADLMLRIGSAFRVRWSDADEDNDAQLMFALDPDLMNQPQNGNEIILLSAVSEDPDGSGDVLDFTVPASTPSGVYRLIGVIRDGLTEVIAAAPGKVHVERSGVIPGDGGGGPGGGTGGPGDPGDGGQDDDPNTDDPTGDPDADAPGSGSGGGPGSSGGDSDDPPSDNQDVPAPNIPR